MATRSSFLERYFPPPRFLLLSGVGLDISANSAKFLSLKKSGSLREIARFGASPVSPGIISEGEIKDPERLGDILRTLAREEKISAVRVSLPEQKAFLFEAAIPHAPQREFRTLVEFQLGENVPLDPGEVEFDYEIRAAHKDHKDVVVTVFPKRAIENYVAALTRAGLTPLSFEIEAQAIARAVVPRGDKGTYMVVDFGETKTGLSVVSEEVVRFMTTLDVAGRSITDAIKKEFGANGAEVERLKMEEGLSRGSKNERLLGGLVTTVSALKDEITKHFVYWQSHPGKKGEEAERPIQKILLCGGNANLKGLPEYLAQSLRVPVERANIWVNVSHFDDYIPPISREQSLGYTTVVGLTLRDFL